MKQKQKIIKEDNKKLSNSQKNIIQLIKKEGLVFAIKFVGDYDTLRKLLKGIRFLTREIMLDFIINLLEEYGSMGVNEIGIDPIIYNHDDINYELHQMEYFSRTRVIVNVYGGINGDIDKGEYNLSWDSINNNDLYTIFNGFMEWFEQERSL